MKSFKKTFQCQDNCQSKHNVIMPLPKGKHNHYKIHHTQLVKQFIKSSQIFHHGQIKGQELYNFYIFTN